MSRKPKQRFTVDAESERGTFRDPSVKHYRILFDGRDHGIRGWHDLRRGHRVAVAGVTQAVPGGVSAERWLNESYDITELPPLCTEQLEMEI